MAKYFNRKVTKQYLHEDMLFDDEREIWDRAKEAYESNDFEELYRLDSDNKCEVDLSWFTDNDDYQAWLEEEAEIQRQCDMYDAWKDEQMLDNL